MKDSIWISVLLVLLNVELASCQTNASDLKNKSAVAVNSSGNVESRNGEAIQILRRVSLRYSSLTYYKAKALNVYSKKGFGDIVSTKRDLEFEYAFPSKIKAVLNGGDKPSIALISENGKTWLENEGRIKTFDDVYWGLTSSDFGPGAFFEIGKLLILKERTNDSLFSLHNPTLAGEEAINGTHCYKIEGSIGDHGLSKVTYWIDKQTFDVLQYERMFLAKKIPSGFYKTVETYTDIDAKP